MDQHHVSAIFDDIANLLELRRDDPFRIRAYRRGAQALLSLEESLQAVARRDGLEDIPGIGKTLAGEIRELLDGGQLRYHDHLKSAVPEGLPALLRVPSLTARQVRALWQQHHVTSLNQLAQLHHAGRTPLDLDAATLDALGGDLAAWERDRNRVALGVARPRAETLAHNLARLPAVQRFAFGGDIRRGAPLVRDIHIIMGSEDPEGLMGYCRGQPEVSRIINSGPTGATMLISEGLVVSLTAVRPEQFAGALLMGTGSVAHLAALRQRADHHGWHLDWNTVADEEIDLYARLELPFIAPELREGRGEVEAADAGNLPHLVSQQDLLGDFRVGSHWGDGASSLGQIAEAARRMGYQYVAVCDAAYSAATGRGLSSGELERQIASIELTNAALPDDFRLLAGVEVDLSADGAVQGPEELLRACDIVLAAARTGLTEPRRQLTARLCKALENPLVHVLALPPARQPSEPKMPDIDMEAILDTAAATHTCLEVSGLTDLHVRCAVERGVMLALGSGAQRLRGLPSVALGVTTARRGWAEPRHLLNTRPFDAVRQYLEGNSPSRAHARNG